MTTKWYGDWDIDREDLIIGQLVNKVSGYSFPGIVVSVFKNTKGQTRYVIEATGEGYKGMLHIFNREQLAPR